MLLDEGYQNVKLQVKTLDNISNNNIFSILYHYGGKAMPSIRKSVDLRNNYGEISEFCHNYREPVFTTKNGQGDLVVMSIETYEEIIGKLELYQKIQIGIKQIKNGKTVPEEKKIKKYAGIQ